ncbi:hypothetical protein ACQPW1_00980 [Nocardia sp. CA-128927]|uniref:hypothetical protein n=1 Tax=Nocardia sp. CA-128927 TaxID=3239975 RepID=UPI003D974C0F
MANSNAKSDNGPHGANPTNSTFSLRLRPADYQNLMSIAGIRRMSIAELAREFILDGLRNALDPDEIERQFEEEKQRLLAAAAEMRKSSASSAGRR